MRAASDADKLDVILREPDHQLSAVDTAATVPAMSEDATSGSSFLLAQEHSAQREHIQRKHAQHSHQDFHRAPNVDRYEERHLPQVEKERKMERHWESAATDVVTISIIKQINVDVDGNTIAIKTIQTHLGDWEATNTPSITSLPSEPFLPSFPSLPGSLGATTAALPILPSDLPASSTVAGTYSSIPGFDAASVQTSTPSLSATDFPSLSAESNSTTCKLVFSHLQTNSFANHYLVILSSSSLSQTYTNSSSSTSNSTRTSSTYLSSSRSISLSESSTESATESTSSVYFSTSTYLGNAADGGVIAAGTGVTPASETGSSTTQSTSDSNPGPSPTPTPVVIGGVVGSLAGAAVLIICLLYIIRWRKRGKGMLSLGSGNDGGDTSRAQPAIQPSGGMTEQTRGFAVPAALAALTGYSKRFSEKTERTVSSTAPSEKGFYRVSGRKLPSVLQTGGDGYGGGPPRDSTLSGSSFYTDSQGFYGGGLSSPPIPLSHRQSAGGIPFMRPSPARTPTQESSPFAFSESVTPPPPRRPDVLGRSHASQDGSHASRFTEEV